MMYVIGFGYVSACVDSSLSLSRAHRNFDEVQLCIQHPDPRVRQEMLEVRFRKKLQSVSEEILKV
jgi:hypothetical protein